MYSLFILDLYTSLAQFGGSFLGEAAGAKGSIEGLNFPAKAEEERRGGGGLINNGRTALLFSNTFSRRNSSHQEQHARAFLKMVWFLDTKEASLAWIPAAWGCGKGRVGEWAGG